MKDSATEAKADSATETAGTAPSSSAPAQTAAAAASAAAPAAVSVPESENERAARAALSGLQLAPKYDKSKSFFDSLSTDRDDRDPPQRPDRRTDAETFGRVAEGYRSRHLTRGGHGGQGGHGPHGGHGGYGGRGDGNRRQWGPGQGQGGHSQTERGHDQNSDQRSNRSHWRGRDRGDADERDARGFNKQQPRPHSPYGAGQYQDDDRERSQDRPRYSQHGASQRGARGRGRGHFRVRLYDCRAWP